MTFCVKSIFFFENVQNSDISHIHYPYILIDVTHIVLDIIQYIADVGLYYNIYK